LAYKFLPNKACTHTQMKWEVKVNEKDDSNFEVQAQMKWEVKVNEKDDSNFEVQEA